MGEVLRDTKTPEQRVFGDAFTFNGGAADLTTQARFFIDRMTKIMETDETVWLPRTLDADNGVSADLRREQLVLATLSLTYDTNLADVYTTSAGGEFGDTTLCEQVPFDEAVTAAETFAANL